VSVDGTAAEPPETRSPWRWPNGARLAVWVVTNVEVFDTALPVTAGGPAGDTAGLAIREYGNRVGLGRLRAILTKHGIRATAAMNAGFAIRYPGLAREMIGDGWEVMGHGQFNNRRLPSYPPGEERKLISECLGTLESVTGTRPRGWLSPGLLETRNTLTHLVGEGVDYVADHICDDQPFPILVDAGAILSIPYSLETNDKPAYDHAGLTPAEFVALAKRQFDVLYTESARTALVFALALHPYLSGLPHRIGAVDEVLQYVRDHEDIWLATGSEIADAYALLHPDVSPQAATSSVEQALRP
jgi:peptidoglycan/xylan/chitin deacetylase (PgdA/CDA1 family)